MMTESVGGGVPNFCLSNGVCDDTLGRCSGVWGGCVPSVCLLCPVCGLFFKMALN